jgi:aryl sulfotransferase
MRRIACFLDIEPDERVWPSLVEAAGFSAMRAAGDQLMPEYKNRFVDGDRHHFFNKGTNGRWRDVFAEEDLALYEMKVREKFSSDLAAWLSSGRLATGEP